MVIDQTTDTYDVYLNTGTADANTGDRIAQDLAFRNGTTSALATILGAWGPAPVTNGVRYDTVTYLAGADLTNPLGGLNPVLLGSGEVLTVDGAASMDTGATLELDIATPTIADRLVVGGQSSSGGTLGVALVAGAPTPQAGDAFDVIDAASFAGTFDAITAPALAPEDAWDLRELHTMGVISVLDARAFLAECTDCLTGPGGGLLAGCASHDQDADNDVDLADYAAAQACVTDGSGMLFAGCLVEE
jgi:hypothetical protein